MDLDNDVPNCVESTSQRRPEPLGGVQRLAGVRHGSHVSDAEVYAEVRMDLMRYATALVGISDAGDVVSSVVARVVERRSLSELDDPKQYLMKSILNESRMRHRSRSRESRAMASLVGEPVIERPDHTLELIMRLPVRQRAVVYLKYYEQYTSTEIADLMGCRPATVRRYLHLARNKLREVISE